MRGLQIWQCCIEKYCLIMIHSLYTDSTGRINWAMEKVGLDRYFQVPREHTQEMEKSTESRYVIFQRLMKKS